MQTKPNRLKTEREKNRPTNNHHKAQSSFIFLLFRFVFLAINILLLLLPCIMTALYFSPFLHQQHQLKKIHVVLRSSFAQLFVVLCRLNSFFPTIFHRLKFINRSWNEFVRKKAINGLFFIRQNKKHNSDDDDEINFD